MIQTVMIVLIYFADHVHNAGIYDEDEGSMLQRSRDSGAHPWCYEQDHCKSSSPSSAWQQGKCKTGKRQSPIDIISSNAKKFDIADTTGRPIEVQWPITIPPVALSGSPNTLNFSSVYKNYIMRQFQLTNNGHSTVLNKFLTKNMLKPKFDWERSRRNAVYKLQQVHFHWGSDDTQGSEHKLDGKAFPLEMHLVHYRSLEGEHGYSSFLSAASSGKSDALAVIGVFFEPSENLTGSFLEPIVSNFYKITEQGDKVLVNLTLDLGHVLQNVDEAFFFTWAL